MIALNFTMKSRFLLFIFVAALIFLPIQRVQAQSGGPVYIVQPGDTLNSIAERFGIGINDLLDSNNLVDPNMISAGTQLVIPSLPDISGVLDTEVVPSERPFAAWLNAIRSPPSCLINLTGSPPHPRSMPDHL